MRRLSRTMPKYLTCVTTGIAVRPKYRYAFISTQFNVGGTHRRCIVGMCAWLIIIIINQPFPDTDHL